MGIIQIMYGLPQVGILANNLIAKRLSNHLYYQVKQTALLWQHVWRPISLTLVVDNFGIGYVGWEHVDHLISALKMYYKNITTDWRGKLYCGITMKWDYTNRYVDISMPRYLNKPCINFFMIHQKATASAISSARTDIWCRCLEN